LRLSRTGKASTSGRPFISGEGEGKNDNWLTVVALVGIQRWIDDTELRMNEFLCDGFYDCRAQATSILLFFKL